MAELNSKHRLRVGLIIRDGHVLKSGVHRLFGLTRVNRKMDTSTVLGPISPFE